MTVVHSVLGKMSKSMGNVTMSTVKGQVVAKLKVKNVKNPKTKKQRIQRAKFLAVSQYASILKSIHRIGFTKIRKGESTSNAFMRVNMKFVEVDNDFNGVLDPMSILCSYGSLEEPEVTVSYKDGRFRITHIRQEDTEGAMSSDMVYVAFLETKLGRSFLKPLMTRGESSTSAADLKKNWQIENVVCYAFAVSESGKESSTSISFVPEVEED